MRLVANPRRVVVFDRDDEGYLERVDRHPDGYIINSYRPPKASYLVLHRATCFFMTTVTTGRGRRSPMPWTGNAYSKVCGTRTGDLIAWSRIGRLLSRSLNDGQKRRAS